MIKSTLITLMLGLSSAVLCAANVPDVQTVSTTKSEVEALQKKIDALKKQLETIVRQVKEQNSQVKEIQSENKQIKEQHPATIQSSAATNQGENAPVFDKGYIAIPGTTAAVKIGGLVKLDVIRDAKAHTGEQTNISRMPYALQMRNANLPNVPTKWKEHFYLHAKQSKIRLDMLVKNKSGNDVTALVEGDFFGSTQFGDNFPPASPTSQVSTTYTFRLRHAVLGYGGFEAGHTTTTFHTTEAYIPEIDLNGLVGGDARHALVRYTHKFGKLAVTAAAEHGRVDYVTYNNAPGAAPQKNYTYNAQDSASNLSKPTRPDLILKLKYDFDNGSLFAISVVNRDLQIKNNAVSGDNVIGTVDGRTYKGTGWGTNIAVKAITYGKSHFIFGVAAGRGIGWYLLEANGRSSLFDPTLPDGQRTYKQIKMQMLLVGYAHYWNAQWNTNIGVARFTLDTQKLSNERNITKWYEPGLDKIFDKFLINTIYSPEENLQFGLEYYVLKRKSTLGYRGLGQRLQFGVSYKF